MLKSIRNVYLLRCVCMYLTMDKNDGIEHLESTTTMHLMYMKHKMHLTSLLKHLSYCRDRVLTLLKTLEKNGNSPFKF